MKLVNDEESNILDNKESNYNYRLDFKMHCYL